MRPRSKRRSPSAAHVVSLDLVSQRLVPSAMEPRSTIAEVDKKSGRLILYVQSQTPGSTRDLLAEAVLKRPKESVRVLVGDIGGGFGQKTSLYPEDGIVAYAAVKLGRKVRWRGDRTDEFVGGTHGRDLTSTGEFALDAKGRVLAYRVRSLGGTGAYLTGTGAIIPLVLGPFVQSGVYDLPLVHYEIKAVMTNTAPVGAYRGAGRPEGVFIVERLMDAAARQIGMDPRTIRKVNYIKPAQLPYTNAVGQVYDSGAFAHMLERASEAGGLGRLCRAQEGREEEGPALRPRPHQLHRMDRRPRAYRKGQPARDSRRPRRAAFGHPGDGAGAADHLFADGGGLARHLHRQDRCGAGRHRSGHRLRQRRLALAVRRRHRGGGLHQRPDREGAREGVEHAGGLGRGHRISRRLAHGGRHRQAHRPVRHRRKRKMARGSASTAKARSTGRAGRTAPISAKSRSIRKPASARWCATPRSTTSASPSIRCW